MPHSYFSELLYAVVTDAEMGILKFRQILDCCESGTELTFGALSDSRKAFGQRVDARTRHLADYHITCVQDINNNMYMIAIYAKDICLLPVLHLFDSQVHSVATVSSSSLSGQVVTFLQPKVASFSAHSKVTA